MEKIDYSDVQGLVFSGYGKMKYACYHPLTIGNASKARQWLGSLIDDNRITKGTDRKQDWCLNIAISYRGFQQLGVTDRHLNSFEFAFQDGMASDRRTTLLQDTDESHQKKWAWGNRQTPIDVLLIIFGKDKSTMDAQNQSEQRSYKKIWAFLDCAGAAMLKAID